MRAGRVFFKDDYAGRVWEDDEGYWFAYDEAYVKARKPSVSLTLPVKSEPYHSNSMIPFFDGLIPEGWLLDVAAKNWKLDNRDRMGLLLVACKDCIGAVSIEPDNSIDNNG